MVKSGLPELRFGSRAKWPNAVPSSSSMEAVMSASDEQFRVMPVGLPVVATMVEGSKRFAVFHLKLGHGAYDGLVAGCVHVEGLEYGDQGRVADFGVGAELVDE